MLFVFYMFQEMQNFKMMVRGVSSNIQHYMKIVHFYTSNVLRQVT